MSFEDKFDRNYSIFYYVQTDSREIGCVIC